MLYLLAGKHGLHISNEGGAETDQQGGHHSRHEVESKMSASQHGSPQHDDGSSGKKKLISTKSCTTATKTATGSHNQFMSEIKCKHQLAKEKAEISCCSLQRSITVDIDPKSSSYEPVGCVEREDGERLGTPKHSPKKEKQSPKKEKLKAEAKAKSLKQELSSEDLLAKRKRCAYHRQAASADPS